MYTFPNSNMPLSVGYNVFYGQILRYSSIISSLDSFLNSVNILYRILLERSYDDRLLKKKFRRLLNDRPGILHKYGILDVNDIHDIIFNVDRWSLTSGCLGSLTLKNRYRYSIPETVAVSSYLLKMSTTHYYPDRLPTYFLRYYLRVSFGGFLVFFSVLAPPLQFSPYIYTILFSIITQEYNYYQ